MSKTKERLKAVAAAIAAIEKQFGKGAIMPLDGSQVTEIEVIPTGSLALDVALGVGGLPRGRIVEIYGPESSGKTTLTLHAIAEAQRAGGVCAFIDAEHAFDPTTRAGSASTSRSCSSRSPTAASRRSRSPTSSSRSGAIDLIVVDSVAALTPKAEIEGDMGDAHMGLQARLMSQALRKLTAVTHKQNTTRASSSTSCGRRSASSSATRRPRPAATRSSSTRRCGSTSAASASSSRARRRSARACGSRSSRTSARRRSARPSSRSCSAPASTSSARWSTWAPRTGCSRSRAPGIVLDGERIGQGRDKRLRLPRRRTRRSPSRCATGCCRR